MVKAAAGMKFFRTIFNLSTGFKHYRTIRDLPVGSSVLYLAQLMALLALGVMASLVPLAFQWSRTAAAWMDQHLPRFSIQNERVVTDVEQPYRAGNDAFLFVLDTTGQTTGPVTSAERGVLVTGSEILFWYQPLANATTIQSRAQSWRGFPEGVVNGAYLLGFVRAVAWVGIPLGYLTLATGGMVFILMQAMFFAVVGSIVERKAPRPLSLTQQLNIAIHAATPASIIVAAYMAFRMWNMDFWLIYLITYGIALIGASNACRDNPPVQPKEDFF
jgi:hypothetical protein